MSSQVSVSWICIELREPYGISTELHRIIMALGFSSFPILYCGQETPIGHGLQSCFCLRRQDPRELLLAIQSFASVPNGIVVLDEQWSITFREQSSISIGAWIRQLRKVSETLWVLLSCQIDQANNVCGPELLRETAAWRQLCDLRLRYP